MNLWCSSVVQRLSGIASHDGELYKPMYLNFYYYANFWTPACIWGPASIQGPASISTIKSDPRLVFEARFVFKDLRYVVLCDHCSQLVPSINHSIKSIYWQLFKCKCSNRWQWNVIFMLNYNSFCLHDAIIQHVLAFIEFQHGSVWQWHGWWIFTAISRILQFAHKAEPFQ